MKRFLSMLLAISLLIICAAPAVCAADGAEPTESHPVPTLDKNFDTDLATTLIIIFCSALALAILVSAAFLAKKNMHN